MLGKNQCCREMQLSPLNDKTIVIDSHSAETAQEVHMELETFALGLNGSDLDRRRRCML